MRVSRSSSSNAQRVGQVPPDLHAVERRIFPADLRQRLLQGKARQGKKQGKAMRAAHTVPPDLHTNDRRFNARILAKT
eukprot:COSAG06_NODE_4243_length_4437_cov_333.188797_3_plen_78_part_00